MNRLNAGDLIWHWRLTQSGRVLATPGRVIEVRKSRAIVTLFRGKDEQETTSVRIENLLPRIGTIPGICDDTEGVDTILLGHARSYRVKTLPHNLTDEEWQRALDHFGGCAYCGRTDTELIKEHYIPVASVGCPGTVAENIVPACSECNSAKGSSLPWEFLKRTENPQARLRIEHYFKGVMKAKRRGASLKASNQKPGHRSERLPGF